MSGRAKEFAAAAALADQVRALTERMVSVDVETPAYRDAAVLVAQAVDLLDGTPRAPQESSQLDLEMPSGLRAHGLLVGPAHPVAPPVRVSWVDDDVHATLRLSRAYEGPRGYVHGGISALVLDEITAKVPSLMASGRVTRMLQLRYRRPVPVETDLVVRAHLVSRDGRDAVARGHIAAAAAPEVALVVAEAHFVVLGAGDGSSQLGKLVD